MKRELAISLCVLSMCVACGDNDPAPTNPGPADPVAPRTGLVAEYRFSGNANDTSGNNQHGTVNGATLVADRFGNANRAYSFDGVDDTIDMAADVFVPGNNLSVSVWVYAPSYSANNQFFVTCSDFAVVANDVSGLNFAISVPASNAANAPVANFAPWHHFLGTYDGTDIAVYLDGVWVDTTNHPGDIADPDIPLRIGERFTSYFAGTLDDLRIYSRTITEADDIYALYHEGGFGL